jgi:murein DD-endopeptidase MepM/ murein hydrolase activator NlpD
MGQQNQPESADAYTVVIFRGSTAKPLRFSFPRKFVRRLLIVAAVLAVGDLLLVSHYVVRTGQVWELSAFRTEAMSAREQTIAFSTAIDDLKRRLTTMKEVNQRLRVMLGIEPVKSGDLVNGRGGEDVPIPEGQSSVILNGTTGSESGSLTEKPARTEQPKQTSALPTEDEQRELLTKVKGEIDALTAEAVIQEKVLQELSAVAEQKSSRWAATPSIWPVKGWVTSGFGPRISPFTEKPAWHDGLDIGAAPNAPVQASALGRVTSVGFDPKLGHIVRLDHGYGIETLYGHLAKSLVKEGQRVKRGEVVGLVGNTGLSTGPHLHYMVKVSGQAIDPRKYILE